MPTATDAQILTLAQWLSPAFPVGGFAYSHGLETSVADGAVTGADEMRDWLADLLRHGSGWTDAVLIVTAYGTGDAAALEGLDAQARALAPSRERLMETVLQGEAFAATAAAVWHHDLPAFSYPVAFGHAAALHRLPLAPALQMYLQAFAANLVSAAVRLVPLGQTEGQRCLASLAPLLPEIAAAACRSTPDDLSSTAFLADIASMRHETMYSRLFRS